jgi:hypothetical protein
MVAFNKISSFVENLAEKVHNLGSDTLKIALTNSAPVASNTVLANITQIANGNGYTTGGATVTVTGSSQTTGTYTLTQSADVSWTSGGTPMAAWRYAVLYNDTATNDELIGWWDRGSTHTPIAAEVITLDLAGTILTIV